MVKASRRRHMPPGEHPDFPAHPDGKDLNTLLFHRQRARYRLVLRCGQKIILQDGVIRRQGGKRHLPCWQRSVLSPVQTVV